MKVGQIIRDAQLDLFEQRDADFLARCRAVAAEVCRQHGSVSINDVRERPLFGASSSVMSSPVERWPPLPNRPPGPGSYSGPTDGVRGLSRAGTGGQPGLYGAPLLPTRSSANRQVKSKDGTRTIPDAAPSLHCVLRAPFYRASALRATSAAMSSCQLSHTASCAGRGWRSSSGCSLRRASMTRSACQRRSANGTRRLVGSSKRAAVMATLSALST